MNNSTNSTKNTPASEYLTYWAAMADLARLADKWRARASLNSFREYIAEAAAREDLARLADKWQTRRR